MHVITSSEAISSKYRDGAETVREIAVKDDNTTVECRWFLRTSGSKSAENGSNLIFIGMNPSEATRFARKNDGGDWTTARIYNCWVNGEFDRAFGSVSSLTLVNAVPIVQKESAQARTTWNRLPVNVTEKLLKRNIEVASMIFEVQPTNSYFVPIWGKSANEDDWRWDGIHRMCELLSNIKRGHVKAITNDGYPAHPRRWPHELRFVDYLPQ